MNNPSLQLMTLSGDLTDGAEFLKPFVIDQIGGLSEFLYKQYAAVILQEFCKSVAVWKETVTMTSTLNETKLMVAPEDPKAEFNQLLSLSYVSGRVAPEYDGNGVQTVAEVLEGKTVSRTPRDPRRHYVVDIKGREFGIQLECPVGTPKHKDIEMVFTMRPAAGQVHVPERILQDNFMGLAAGIMAKLQLMPHKNWSNPELGSFNQNNYYQAIAAAKADMNRNALGNDRIIMKVPRGVRF